MTRRHRRAQASQADSQLEDRDRRLRIEGHEHIVGGSLCSCVKTDLSPRFGAVWGRVRDLPPKDQDCP